MDVGLSIQKGVCAMRNSVYFKREKRSPNVSSLTRMLLELNYALKNYSDALKAVPSAPKSQDK
jgi:hypothetical protein